MDVRLEDGTVIQNVPEGTTKAALMARLGRATEEAGPKGSAADGFGNSIVNSFTFGLMPQAHAVGDAIGDKLAGMVTGKESSFGDSYRQSLAQTQADEAAFKKEHPWQNAAGFTIGSLASLGGGAIPTAKTMIGKVLQGGKLGAGIGGLSGAGESDWTDPVSAAGHTGTSAAIGGVIGAAMPPVIEGATKLGKALYGQVMDRLPFKQPTAAARKLAEALQRDGLSPADALARVQEMGPQGALLDAGPNVRSLARSAATVPGKGKTAISEFLTERQEGTRGADKVLQGGQGNRVIQQLDDLVPENFYAAKDATIAARKKLGQGYEAARSVETPVDTKALIADLDAQLKTAKGGIQSGLSKARSYLFTADGKPDTSIAGLHEAKMAIDDLINGTGDSSIGRTAQARLKDVQARLVDAIESAAPDYKAARLGTAAEWQKADALEAGAKFLSKGEFKNPTEIALSLKQMGPEELNNFRTGVVRAIKDKIGDLPVRADATKRLMDIPALEQKIRLAFGDDAMFQKYIKGLEGEKALFDAYSKIMGGSRTGEVLAEQADAKLDPSRIAQGVRTMISGNPMDWLRGGAQVLGGTKDRILMPEARSKELAKLLTGRDIAPIQQQFEMQQLSAAQRDKLARALISPTARSHGQ